ncbi:MAG: aminotransferase class I/II-fold pyridoxal phosphate-dependent enzyme, partial [Bacilli bacterium]
MKKLNQEETPFLTSVTEYIGKKVVPFDVPGHHMGNMDSALKNCLGKKVFEFDINAPIGLDNLAHPAGVLKAAEDLMAQATGADNAFFLINGTSSGILAMLLTVCKAEDKIILPRNVHKSIINGLILSGAAPIFVMPTIDMELEIANQPTLDDYKKAIIKYPSAKAVFVINPTYFGAVADLANLVKFAHAHNVTVLVDEAHGAHFYFSETGPRSAMDCGADMTAISFHKTAGSLTQSSVLLQQGNRVTADAIQRVLNMINTTSPSSILMASLDSARQYMALHGREAMKYTFELVDYAIKKIDNIKGFIVCNEKHFWKKGCYDYDRTKLVLELDKISLSGFEVYYKLKKEYGVQIELAETYALLCIITAGTTKAHINALAKALNAISKQYYSRQLAYPRHSFSVKFPFQLLRPRLAFDAPNKCVNINDAEYQVSNESIMIYPPGIPLIIPGEVFTPTLIKRIKNYKKTGVTILSHYDNGNVDIVNLENWRKYKFAEIKLKEYEMNHLISPRSDDYIAPFEGKEHQGTL